MTAVIILVALVWGLPLTLLAVACLAERASASVVADPWDTYRPDGEAWDRHVSDMLAMVETPDIDAEWARFNGGAS